MSSTPHPAPRDPDPNWVWATPATGTPWCTCGIDPLTRQPRHQVTRPLVTKYVAETLGHIPEQLSNGDIARVTLALWRWPEVTPPIADALMRSVQAVHGQMAEHYPLATGLAAVRHFSNTWSGHV